MRCTDIQIHAKIPVSTSSNDDNAGSVPCFRDGNGYVYQIDAIKNACEESCAGIPIIRYKDDGQAETIGIAQTVKWNQDGFIEVDGTLRFGGTSENVIFDAVNNVASMTIVAIGLGS